MVLVVEGSTGSIVTMARAGALYLGTWTPRADTIPQYSLYTSLGMLCSQSLLCARGEGTWMSPEETLTTTGAEESLRVQQGPKYRVVRVSIPRIVKHDFE